MKLKTTALILALGALSQANAGMYNMCKEGVNMVPCEAEAWDIGIEGLYLKNSGHFYENFVATNTDFDSEFALGVRVEGSYHFGTGNDLTVNWAHIKANSDGTDPQGNFFDNAAAIDFTQKSKMDLVNVEFGQHLDFGERFDIRIHAGVQFAKLEERYDTREAFGNFNINDEVLTDKVEAWGPRIGVDTSFLIADNFDFFTNVALAGLSIHGDITVQDTLANAFSFGSGTFDNRKTELGADIAIGARYTYQMGSGDLSAKVAWEDHLFINAGAGDDTISWEGVTFGVKWVGNV